MNGGLVIPKRSIVWLGIIAIMLFKRVGRSVSMSLPQAPVSSDVSQISITPSSIAQRARSTIAWGSQEPSLPLACLVLQQVQDPRQPVERGMISTRAFFLIFGRSRIGRSFLASNLTLWPLSASSTTSTTLSICVTPRTETSSSPLRFLSPCGTQPDTMTGFPCFQALATKLMNFSCDGFLTVHELRRHASALSMSSTMLYPQSARRPAIYSLSLILCEQPQVLTNTDQVPGAYGP